MLSEVNLKVKFPSDEVEVKLGGNVFPLNLPNNGEAVVGPL